MNKCNYIKKILLDIEKLDNGDALKRANTIVVCTQPFYDKVYNDTYIKGYKYTYLELMVGVDGINPYYPKINCNSGGLSGASYTSVKETETTAPVYEDYYIYLAEWRDKQIDSILKDE